MARRPAKKAAVPPTPAPEPAPAQTVGTSGLTEDDFNIIMGRLASRNEILTIQLNRANATIEQLSAQLAAQEEAAQENGAAPAEDAVEAEA